MNTTTQILLSIMILLLGTTLTLIGVQLFLILQEIRKNIMKFNLILEDLQELSSNLASSSQALVRVKEALAAFSHQGQSPFTGWFLGLILAQKLLKSLFSTKKEKKNE